jgi:microcystin-dependent protein
LSNIPPVNIIPTANYPMLAANGTVNNVWYRWFAALQSAVAKQLPIGTIFASASENVPVGALPCDGREVSRSVYSDLFNEIGTSWGSGDGRSTFNIPLIDDFVRGSNGGAIGSRGGSSSSTLSSDNLPLQDVTIHDPGHTHAFVGDPHTHAISDPGHDHASIVSASNGTSGSNAVGEVAGNTGTAVTDIVVDDTTATGTNVIETTGITATVGSDSPTPIDVVPPYVVIQWMIYTGVGQSAGG